MSGVERKRILHRVADLIEEKAKEQAEKHNTAMSEISKTQSLIQDNQERLADRMDSICAYRPR